MYTLTHAHMATRTHGHRWTHEHMVTRTHGHKDRWTHGHTYFILEENRAESGAQRNMKWTVIFLEVRTFIDLFSSETGFLWNWASRMVGRNMSSE
jgi:hypothetical protein